MIKGSVQQENTPKGLYTKELQITFFQKKLKGETNLHIVGDFNWQTTRQNQLDIELYDTINQEDLIDIYRTPTEQTAEYTFFSAHGTFTKIDLVLGHNINLKGFKRTEIIECVLWLKCYQS